MSKSLVFDLEADNLLLDVTKVWCASTECIETGEKKQYRPDDIDELLSDLGSADMLIGHNILGYDLPALEKVYGFTYDGQVRDTLLWSKLEYLTLFETDGRLIRQRRLPKKLMGSHSLKAWGYRLKEHKGEYNDWSKFTEEMLTYCTQDVTVTTKLYKKLLKGDTPLEALELEQDVQRIIVRQFQNGWLFDVKKAQALHVQLLEIMEPLEKEISGVFLPKFLADGPTKTPKKPFRRLGVWTLGEHQPIKLRPFNPRSGKHIIWWLTHDYGWEPVDFTENGSPKTGADVLRDLSYDGIKPLLDWLDANKLLTMLAEGDNAWLKQYRRDTGRIHGSADILGANTGRFTHSKPNVAQTPSSSAFMGHEARSLFIARPGYTLVGADAAALELRMLSHFMARYDGGRYGKIVDEGDSKLGTDVHTQNQKAAGLPTRDNAKTFIYGWLYGAGDAKIGRIVDKDAKVGAKLKAQFLKATPGVADLITNVKKQVEPISRGGKGKRYLKGLSGRRLLVRSPHSALNLILQSGGAYYMKYVLIELDRRLQAGNYDYYFVGNIHDEVQLEVRNDHVEEVCDIILQTFEDVGYLMGLRCRMAGDVKTGASWAETH